MIIDLEVYCPICDADLDESVDLYLERGQENDMESMVIDCPSCNSRLEVFAELSLRTEVNVLEENSNDEETE